MEEVSGTPSVPGVEGAAKNSGSRKPGPSDDYLALLRHEITSEEYVRRLKALVDERNQADLSAHRGHALNRVLALVLLGFIIWLVATHV